MKTDRWNRTPSQSPEQVRKAVILAAGVGDRLRPFTNKFPKALVEVGGVSILDNTLTHLAACGTKEVAIVVGHHKEVILERYGSNYLGMLMAYVVSKDYETTNNIHSLWLARDHLTQDVLLLEADVFFERAVLERLLSQGATNLAVVSGHQSWMSGTVVTVDSRGRIQATIDAQHQEKGFDYSKAFKTANIYLFRRAFLSRYFLPQLQAYISSRDYDEYYESILITLGHRGKNTLIAVDCDDLKWYEIDDESDRLAAEYMFASPEKRYEHVQTQHGGYWRFGFVDHAYLYNPYYPPPTVFIHLKDDLHDLVLHYPAGQKVVARLVGTLIDQPPSRILVGNGASELVRIIASHLPGRIACPVPSFNEYENAARTGAFVPFMLPTPSFELDVDVFAEQVIASEAEVAIVVTPNNPTSLVVPRADILRLAEKLETANCMLVVDESFVDFTDDWQKLSVERWVDRVPNLAVLKSLSKSFGVGGLRLGYLLTANEEFAKSVRAELHIWNINGFAESFLRQAPRYRKVFRQSCALVRDHCYQLYRDLTELSGVTVYRPQANFVMCRVPASESSALDLAQQLFVKHNILVKHCGGKHMEDGDRYLRLASKTESENRELVEAMRECLRL
jgi:histidinol-phosphate/aromatic aminotransferase/cobyric acid decarboxylase-like protein/CTP:phosphocholine cytidylyltransferase-like protein